MQPGIMPNGLFWTAQIAGGDFRMNRRTAVLSVTAYPLVQTYQAFSTAAANPGLVTVRVRWTATGEAVERGKGADVPADDQAAFLGLFSDARATATVEGYSPGLNFKSNNLSSDGFYANMGRMHNGAYL